MTSLERAIDACIAGNGLEYDIAVVASKIEGKVNHRYTDNKEWEYLDDTGKWMLDVKNKRIKDFIRHYVAAAIMDRSVYWQNQSNTAPTDTKFEYQVRTMRLLDICNKMTRDRVLSAIEKECRAFFIDE